MPATRLRECLVSLGSTGTAQIEYIETYYGHTDYLDKVCDATLPGSSFDQELTEAQPDVVCTSSAYRYPSHCSQGWLGNDCSNGCANYIANYAGFYCKGRYIQII